MGWLDLLAVQRILKSLLQHHSSKASIFRCSVFFIVQLSHPYITQDRRVMVKSSDKTWSTGVGNGKPLQYSCHENPMNSIKRQKDRTLKGELLRPLAAQYAIREEGKITPERMKHPVVDATGDGSKV